MLNSTLPETLAIEGGQPAYQAKHAIWPVFDQEMLDEANRVLRSGKVNYWTGQDSRLFEKEYAASIGRKHAIALANGTLALELALFALDIGPGDEVIVPSRTFMATASSVVMRGATPVFADVECDSQNMSAATIQAVMTKRTKAIIAVHLAGWPCEMDPIMQLANEHGLYVIEDCAQAHGSFYKGRPAGALGHMAAFSFCQDKIITTAGEGGLLVLDDDVLWNKAWSYKDHGKDWDAVYNRQHATVFKWVHESFGTNWRITEVQSAIGRVALRRLPEWIATRRKHASIWQQQLSSVPGLYIPEPPSHIDHSYYKFYAYLRPESLRAGWTRDRVVHAINAEGVPCAVGSCAEVYLEKAFDNHVSRPTQRLPIAKHGGEHSLMFLVDPALTEQNILAMSKAVKKVLQACLVPQHVPARKAA